MSEQNKRPTSEAFSYVDAHGVEISAYAWLPDPEVTPEPVAVVQIAHGIGEHALRYDAFARFLTQAGLAVYADDHRGHGETGRRQHGGDLSLLGKLGPGGLRAAEAAIVQFTGLIRERHPGLKVAMFGHSWGSLMTQRILNEHPKLWDAVVLSGSAFRTFKHMESGDLNANWASVADVNGFEWLSRDPETAAAFIADPLCFEANVLKLFGVADGLRLYGKPGPGLDPLTPMLIVSGSEDPLSRGDGLKLLADAYRARGMRDISVKIYAEGRHEMLNETNRDEVFEFLATWILEHTAE
ncbi:alpha/beta fold hydrolase [Leucobacter denitrificans]|uniref:Alpha/beta fold hydrolase n=1 Tax=Leucobacter denitrificans TaxID=683042 RepID=A0A7G9S258_9MICO|nr:alpha/beta hydrolase [Leucobacter denitrificans]QNN61933.1 alpha/beta fold hydrolase [Leucobacter denitrificans]